MRMKPVLTLDDAKKMLAAGEAEAARNKWEVVIAVLNDNGILIALHAMDGSRPGNPPTAIKKATTAVMTQRSSKVFMDWVHEGRTSLLGMGFLPLQGGLPVIIDGQCLGAIGVSGVTSEEDEQIGRAAIYSVFPNAVFIRPGD
ncbi:MAG: heme-binding protein [Proteobacteria bacterium]|nr:heme-binding protein [Pseudomonadota bacterium]